jgi:2-oxoglutarate dehydrogenase E1 component
VQANGELVSALDGNWGAVEKAVWATSSRRRPSRGQSLDPAVAEQATRDSVRAIMMIRAFRMRGHLHANLDPLGLAQKPDDDYNELSPEAYGFTEADYDRPIFIDTCWGLNTRPSARCSTSSSGPIARRIGVEFMHISNPEEKSWIQERIEGPDKGVAFTAEWARRRSCNKLIEAEGFEKFIDVKYKGTKRFGLDGGESISRRWSRSSSAAAAWG